jgi:hypothetical protein
MSSETVTILKSELERLRKLEEDIPAIIQRAKEEQYKDALAKLHQRDKENPEIARQRAMKRYAINKEEIKAKRREAYYRKKEEAKTAAAGSAPGSLSSIEEKTPESARSSIEENSPANG